MQIPINYPPRRTVQSQLQQQSNLNITKHGLFGFRAQMFPLLGAILSSVTIIWTYLVARHKYPTDIKPFPYTDITHTAIKYPQYVIFRIGMMVTPVLFCISFQILKYFFIKYERNFIEMKSFQIRGVEERRVRHFGPLSILCCLMLCLSTSTISDGKDMDWTAHTIGATSFFILAMYMCLTSSRIYRELYFIDNSLCPKWSFLIKKYNLWVIVGLLGLTVMDSYKLINIGSLVEWLATFYLILYFASMYGDFKEMDVMMERKKNTQNDYGYQNQQSDRNRNISVESF